MPAYGVRGGGSNSGMGSNAHNEQKVFEVPMCSEDTISKISIHNSLIAASSWAGDIRLWELQPPSSATPRAMTNYNAPVLSCAFDSSGGQLFSGSCDNIVRVWDVASNQSKEIGKHDLPVKEVRWIPSVNMLVSSSWDKTVRWWDTRSPNPVLSVNLPERAYAMDVVDNFILVACAQKKIVLFDISNPSQVIWQGDSKLKMETRTISLFPDKEGFGLGSAEARCSIQHFQPMQQAKDFSFKCHRDKDQKGMAYPLNSVNFHPLFGTFATCGGDGQYNIWDKDARHRISNGMKRQMPVTTASWNSDGSLFVFAIGYDWSKGMEEYEKVKKVEAKRPKLFVHVVKEEEVRPKSAQQTR
eukprot:TRINITY_DN2873_c0_g1_i1.p1 TRINITY_DN2873_c0_g1~~TRINITY_DN2873_c0_g1_i1.p1  ORF type:complete len:356 (-),score=95.04 TRINITY_DN2873_c0_g1_i1:57-1124(-)